MLPSKPPYVQIVSGHGSYLRDSKGKNFLDFTSALFTANLGHGNRAIIEPMVKALHEVGTFSSDFVYSSRAALAKKLIQILPDGYGKVSFQSNGTDAVEAAIMIARQVTGKNGIVGQYLSYHGSSSETFSSADWPSSSHPPNIAGYIYCFPPYHLRCPFCRERKQCDLECAQSLKDAIEYSGPERIAAVILEPIMGGLVNELVAEYLRLVEEICRKYEILLIVDEVLTGFGRTGKMFCFEHANIKPDIITLGKALTSGYAPLSATILTKRISDFYENHSFEFGFTLGGHPVACSAALATIRYFDAHDVLGKSKHSADYMRKRLEELRDEHDCIAEVRGEGLLFCLEFREGAVSARWTKDEALKKRLIVEKGIFEINILAPPLTANTTEIDSAIEVLDGLFRTQGR
jgi:hypothetical protein